MFRCELHPKLHQHNLDYADKGPVSLIYVRGHSKMTSPRNAKF